MREWIQLLDTNDGGVVLSTLFAGIDQVVIHLAGTGNHTLDFFRIDLLVDLTDHGLETSLRQIR